MLFTYLDTYFDTAYFSFLRKTVLKCLMHTLFIAYRRVSLTNIRRVRLAYQPPANSTFLSKQTSHQQPGSSTFLLEQTSTSHQPPAKRTG
jgi:hypothetical protein